MLWGFCPKTEQTHNCEHALRKFAAPVLWYAVTPSTRLDSTPAIQIQSTVNVQSMVPELVFQARMDGKVMGWDGSVFRTSGIIIIIISSSSSSSSSSRDLQICLHYTPTSRNKTRQKNIMHVCHDRHIGMHALKSILLHEYMRPLALEQCSTLAVPEKMASLYLYLQLRPCHNRSITHSTTPHPGLAFPERKKVEGHHFCTLRDSVRGCQPMAEQGILIVSHHHARLAAVFTPFPVLDIARAAVAVPVTYLSLGPNPHRAGAGGPGRLRRAAEEKPTPRR